MRFFGDKIRRGGFRSILVLFTVLLLCCIGGAAASDFDTGSALKLSSRHAKFIGNYQAETTRYELQLSQGASSASSAVSSTPAPSSVPPVSSSAPPASSAPGSSAPAVSSGPPAVSKPPVSSAPPMNPAVYQAMYPGLYVEKPSQTAQEEKKTVYLTFDDGPSHLTGPLLDVLDRYHVKATFFLVGKTGPEDLKDMKEIVDRGHAIGVHSYTHQLTQIYRNPAVFLDDFAKMHELILKTTGVDTYIYRFAGGSVNDYNKTTAKAIITEMNRRGYTYFDWNVSSADAEKGTSASAIYTNVINGVHAHTRSVILCHNTAEKGNTLAQMPKIIETLLKEGYVFKTLDDTVDNRPYIFRVPK